MNLQSEFACDKLKRKHITLTIQEKLDIIELVEEGNYTRQAIAMRYGIGKSTVHDICKRKDKIRKFAVDNSLEIAKRRRLDVNMEKLSNTFTFVNELVEDDEHFDENETYEYNGEKFDVAVITYEPQLEASSLSQEPTNEDMSVQDVSMVSKRKSKTLTIKEKYDIIKLVEEGMSVPSICSQFGIGRTTVYDFMKSKQKIIEYVEKAANANRRTFKKSSYPEVEERMDEWCQERAGFTKKEFYESCKEIFRELKNNLSLPSQFSQSWSWCHRFFERHPEHKIKLISSNGKDGEYFSPTKDEFFYESGSKHMIEFISADNHSQERKKFTPNRPSDKARKNEISKVAIYDVSKNIPTELRQSNKTQVTKSAKYPKLESEFSKWCLEQKTFPNSLQTTEKALSIFNSLQLKGSFNPSSFAKNFIQRQADLSEKNNSNILQANKTEACDKENINFQCLENEAESIDLMEEELLEEDYIVEELDLEMNHQSEIEYLEEFEYETEALVDDQNEISDADAMNSLKTLIKYAEQHNHIDYLNLFLEYQSFVP